MAASCLGAARRSLAQHFQPARITQPDEAVQRRPAGAAADGGRAAVRAVAATDSDLYQAGPAHPVMVTERTPSAALPPPAMSTPPTAPRRQGRAAALPARGLPRTRTRRSL